MVAIEKERETETEFRLPTEVQKILHTLASQWEDVLDDKKLQVVQLKGAMTNEVFQCLWVSKKEVVHRKVLVRIYGEGVDVFFDREDEIRTFECMSKHGQGPRLLGHFPNGRVEEFIHARFQLYLYQPKIVYYRIVKTDGPRPLKSSFLLLIMTRRSVGSKRMQDFICAASVLEHLAQKIRVSMSQKKNNGSLKRIKTG